MYIHRISVSLRRGSRQFSKGGGLRREILEEKCLLIHVSYQLDKHATLSLFFLFKRIVFYFLLCFITLFYFLNLKGGVATPVTPPPF